MIINHTPFVAEVSALWDHELKQYYTVLLSAAFEARPGSPVRPVKADVIPGDMYFGVPGRSSIRYEADLVPEKQRVDVIVNAHACAPSGREVERLMVSFKVGNLFKRLMITGDRLDRARLGVRPKPFVRMPIIYERAYGGTASGSNAIDLRNPVGISYRGARSADPNVETVLPNVGYEDGRSTPAGFGVIARQWQPRLAMAGTYDDRWLADRYPLLPADFDVGHYQAAPMDQQSDSIRGGEDVELMHMTPESIWRFRLPILRVPVHLLYSGRGDELTLRLDTIILEPDEYRITMKARAKVPIRRNQVPLRQVIVGHISRGWWRSRITDKMYFDPRGLSGRQLDMVDYEA
jgi:hypothetical protein